MGVEFFHEETDRQTDGKKDRHDEANSRFSQFLKVSKNYISYDVLLELDASSVVSTLVTSYLTET